MSTTFDRRLIAAARAGLPLVSRPYDALGATLGVGGDAVRERLAALGRSAASAASAPRSTRRASASRSTR